MKLSWSFVASSLYCAAAAAREAHVYIHDPISRASPQPPSEVNPETARLILAKRLGLSQFHSLGKNPSREALDQINAFGGSQQKLFGAEDPDRTKARLLVWIEDVVDVGEIIRPSTWSSSFAISNPPPASDNDRLIQDMIRQAEALPKKADPKGNTYKSGIAIDGILSHLKQPNVHSDYLTIFHADKTDNFSPSELGAQLELLASAAKGEASGVSITVVLMPPSSPHSKRTARPYGTYDVPNLGARREPTEAPLSLAPSKPSTSPNPISDLEDFPVIAQADSNSTAPPLGILKSCYSSESACLKTTNNCTGHGACRLLHKGGKERTDCYGCSCVPTVVKVGGDTGMETHKKTTYWGGPACQKKDVSVPFWLFVGTGVLLAFLISSGIGLLYSMGSEELPSVIGAGVSGPVRK